MRNVAASVKQRLLNLARAQQADYNLMLVRYATERFLYRLGLSPETERFVLKGAVLFRLWAMQDFRPTRDGD
ncbi:MAG: nucleotidyl transferase AbiEii/AbiGii toxin family protein, partial [Candidatus Tectomicrobia bacterium]|nr:nucleotidyl transferase AbiEii/AbiGii toxin family protein [Candidatus Tectomicrobia bacterium]